MSGSIIMQNKGIFYKYLNISGNLYSINILFRFYLSLIKDMKKINEK